MLVIFRLTMIKVTPLTEICSDGDRASWDCNSSTRVHDLQRLYSCMSPKCLVWCSEAYDWLQSRAKDVGREYPSEVNVLVPELSMA